MFCTNCGAQISDDARFCSNCGASVSQDRKLPGWSGPQQYTADVQRKRPPVVLYMVAVVLLLSAAAMLYLAVANAREKDPLHGARLKKQTIWEADGLRVDVTGLQFDKEDAFPYQIKLEIANQSKQDLTIRCKAMAVNRYGMDSRMSVAVPAGSSVKDVLSISKRSMWTAGIAQIGTVDLLLEAEDTGTGEMQIRSDVLTFQTNKTGSQPDHNIRRDAIYEGDEMKVWYVTCYPQYDDDNQALEFYVENNTDKIITLKSGTTAAGGIDLTNTDLQAMILPNSRCYVYLKINRNELDSVGQLPMHHVTTELLFYDFDTGEPIFELPANLTV